MQFGFKFKKQLLIVYVVIAVFAVIQTVNAQGKQIPPELTGGVQIETHSQFYNEALLEMADMLDGKAGLSVKRAVFLLEWAYLDGELEHYSQNITALQVKANMTNNLLINHLASNGGVFDDRALMLDEEWQKQFHHINELGWKEMSDELYKELMNGVEEEKKKEAKTEATDEKERQ